MGLERVGLKIGSHSEGIDILIGRKLSEVV
jgi:hypothetical protein